MKILKYAASQTSLLKPTAIEKTKNQKISFIKYTKHTEDVFLTEQGIKNLIKILKRNRSWMKYCNMVLFLFFPLIISSSKAKADLSSLASNVKNDFLNTMTEIGNFILKDVHPLMVSFLIWTIFVGFFILKKKIKR